MIESRKFVAAAILAGLALVIAGLILGPVGGGAKASSRMDADIVAERIGGAFATISDRGVDPMIAVDSTRMVKGDKAATGCAGATWPNIDAACLTTVSGIPAPQVRTITVGYQAGPTTTILLRVPAAEMAQR